MHRNLPHPDPTTLTPCSPTNRRRSPTPRHQRHSSTPPLSGGAPRPPPLDDEGGGRSSLCSDPATSHTLGFGFLAVRKSSQAEGTSPAPASMVGMVMTHLFLSSDNPIVLPALGSMTTASPPKLVWT